MNSQIHRDSKQRCSAPGCVRGRRTWCGYIQSRFCTAHAGRMQHHGDLTTVLCAGPKPKFQTKPWFGSNGYMKVNRQGREMYVHRIMCEVSFGPIPRGHHVHHRDGNKTNNHPMNLRLLSESEHHRLHRGDE